MDSASKKRKAEENGAATLSPTSSLTTEDARKILESFSQDQLVDIVAEAMCRDAGVLDAVRVIAGRDPAQRKLFIRGLGWETTSEKLRSIFSKYGELDEAVVITDKASGKSKGYGFVTFHHIDGALLSLKEPSKKIDGRMTVTQLAAAGAAGPIASAPPVADVSQRKIYVGNVPADMLSDRLLAHFSSYGEIEEGPLGFDKQTGKFRGYALFVYKTVEAAQAAIAESVKSIDGNILQCKLAIDGKKGRPVAALPGTGLQGQLVAGTGADGYGDLPAMGSQTSLPGSLSGQFGGGPSSGFSSYGGFSGSVGLPGVAAGFSQHNHPNSSLQPSNGLGNSGLLSLGSQVPSSLSGSGAGGYSGLSSGPYGSSGQYSGSGGYGVFATGSALYRVPTGSAGMPSSGYPESGLYSSSSSMYQGQQNQALASSPGSRVPPGSGMYQSIPHYY